MESRDYDFLKGLAGQTDMKAAAKKLMTRLKKRLTELSAAAPQSLDDNVWQTIYEYCDQLTDYFEEQQVNGVAFWEHFQPILEQLFPKGLYNAIAKHLIHCELARSYNNLLGLDVCPKEEAISLAIGQMDQAIDFAFGMASEQNSQDAAAYNAVSLAQSIFGYTFVQLYVSLYDDAASKRKIQEYIRHLSKYEQSYSFRLLAVVRYLGMLSEGTQTVRLDYELLTQQPEKSLREITLPDSAEEVMIELGIYDDYDICEISVVETIRLGSHIRKFELCGLCSNLKRLIFAARPQFDDEQWGKFKELLVELSYNDYEQFLDKDLEYLIAYFEDPANHALEVYFGQKKVWPNANTAKYVFEKVEEYRRCSESNTIEEPELPF